MSNTPTPRTDAAIGLLKVGVLELVDADFARQLECELVEAKAKQYNPPTQAIHLERDRLEQERDSWRKCAEELAKSCQYMGTTDAERVEILIEKDKALTTFNKLKQQEKE